VSARACVVAAMATAIATVMLACSPPQPAGCVVDGGAVLAIGSGNPNNPTQYRPLQDGDTVNLVPGTQGGQHVWIQVHVQNVCPDHPRVRLVVARASDGAVVGFSQFAGSAWTALPGSPGTFTSVPMAAAIEPDQYCQLVHGGNIRVSVSVDDTMGHMVSGMVSLTIDGWTPDASPTERSAREACCADYSNTMCWPNGPPDGAPMIDAVDAMDDIRDTGGETVLDGGE
jgi:hypothetical protein